jgi:hypothetical protein
MPDIPPREIPCVTGDGTPATTLVGPDPDGAHVVVQLASTSPFTVSLQVEGLIQALRDCDSIGVPCLHAEHGERLLGVNPHLWWEHLDEGPMPMELYLLLPDDQEIEVVFTVKEVVQLISALRQFQGVVHPRHQRRHLR